eukprot:Ihof_evm1s26 gene=Ihof_evmTU1s26
MGLDGGGELPADKESIFWDFVAARFQDLCQDGFLGMLMLPIIFLLVAGSYRVYELRIQGQPTNTMGSSYMYYSKLVMCVIAMLCELTDGISAVLAMKNDHNLPFYTLFIPVMLWLALMFVIGLMVWEHSKHNRVTIIITLFWIILAITAFFPSIDLGKQWKQ